MVGDVYVYDGSQRKIYENLLPAPVAYGCSFQLVDGMLCIGGCNSKECLDDVYILRLNSDGNPYITPCASMPFPLSNMTGNRIGNKVYVAGVYPRCSIRRLQRHFYASILKLESGRNLNPGVKKNEHSQSVQFRATESTIVCIFSAEGISKVMDLGMCLWGQGNYGTHQGVRP